MVIMNSFISNNKYINTNFAVKAIIYNHKGEILLQQRDFNKKIPYPGYWNFFGGLIENDEKPIDALKRELSEELSCIPGQIKKKIFDWKYGNEWNQSINYFFPVEYKKCNIKLREGNKYKWFKIENIVKIKCTPAIYFNLEKIFNLIFPKNNKIKNIVIKNIEDNLINKYDLLKKNNRVFYTNNQNTLVTNQQIYLLKFLAKIKKVSIFRLCLHKNDKELVHEMIMFHTSRQKVGPLRQNKKSISYNILDGSLKISKCNKLGKITKTFEISNKKNHENLIHKFIRIDANEFRIVRSTSEYCIFIETIEGPFKDSDTIWLHKK